MTRYRARFNRIDLAGRKPKSPEAAKDDGGQAWRIMHIPSNSCIPIQFGREIDAARGAELLEQMLPSDNTDRFELVKEALAKYGTFDALKRELVANCCAW